LEHCRIFSEGRKNHFYEIMETQKEAFQNIAEINVRSEKYRKYAVPAVRAMERISFRGASAAEVPDVRDGKKPLT